MPRSPAVLQSVGNERKNVGAFFPGTSHRFTKNCFIGHAAVAPQVVAAAVLRLGSFETLETP